MTRELPTSLLLFMAHRAAEDEIFAAVAAAGHGGITRAQGRLLAGIDEGGTRVGLLAERARVAKQTAVSLVDHLVAAGYVERVPDPADGRDEADYSIIELNFNPALHIHDYPETGKNRQVERYVLDLIGIRQR